jgi:ribosome-associated heat shock protein Hsp15
MVNRDADDDDADSRARLDKWLWCTRFYKSRALATDAVAGGRVKLNGQRVKAAHPVRVGDLLEIAVSDESREVVVQGLPDRRGPAPEAQRCYAETEASVARRTEHRERKRLAGPDTFAVGRPDKRDRRRLEAFRRGLKDR